MRCNNFLHQHTKRKCGWYRTAARNQNFEKRRRYIRQCLLLYKSAHFEHEKLMEEILMPMDHFDDAIHEQEICIRETGSRVDVVKTWC